MNLPMIQQASHLVRHAKLRSMEPNVDSKGKDLVPIPIGSCIIYDSNPDHKTNDQNGQRVKLRIILVLEGNIPL